MKLGFGSKNLLTRIQLVLDNFQQPLKTEVYINQIYVTSALQPFFWLERAVSTQFVLI